MAEMTLAEIYAETDQKIYEDIVTPHEKADRETWENAHSLFRDIWSKMRNRFAQDLAKKYLEKKFSEEVEYTIFWKAWWGESTRGYSQVEDLYRDLAEILNSNSSESPEKLVERLNLYRES